MWSLVTIMHNYKIQLLNQACAGRRRWFLEIAFVRDVGVCVGPWGYKLLFNLYNQLNKLLCLET